MAPHSLTGWNRRVQAIRACWDLYCTSPVIFASLQARMDPHYAASRRGGLRVPACSEPGYRLGQSLPQRGDDMRTLAIAFTMVPLPWHAEAQTPRLFENDRVRRWRLAPGKRAEPLLAEDAFRASWSLWRTGRYASWTTSTRPRHATWRRRRASSHRDQGASQRQTRDAARNDTGFPARGARRVVENDHVAVCT